jgi:hypothetical protein
MLKDRQNMERIVKGELVSSRIEGKYLILRFQDRTTEKVPRKRWHRYYKAEVIWAMSRANQKAFLDAD